MTVRVRNLGQRGRPVRRRDAPVPARRRERGRRHRRRRAHRSRPGRRWRPRAGCPPAPRTGSTATSAGSGTAPSTPRSPTWSATTTAGPGCGCAGRSASSSSPSTRPGRGCRSTPATPCPEGQRRRSLAVEPMTCPPNALADGRGPAGPRARQRLVGHLDAGLDGRPESRSRAVALPGEVAAGRAPGRGRDRRPGHRR